MKIEQRKEQSASRIGFFFLLILSLSGCGGGGESSQVIEAPPGTPAGVSVVITASNELTLSWGSAANAASYNIYWSTLPGISKTSTKISGVTATNYAHKPLTTGSTYYYAVTAMNNYGESDISAEVFVLLDIPRPPGAIAAVAGDGQATLSWSADVATVSYNIYMASQSGVTKANYATLTGGMAHTGVTSPYTHTGLTNGTAYYFVVTSVNSFGESSESGEVAATPATGSALTVSGSVKYEDKEYGTSGFTGNTTYKAVRFAEVEAVEATSGATIVAGTTDATGSYVLTLPSASAIHIRVISSAATPPVAVKDISNALYSAAGSNFTASGSATANIHIPATNQAAGAFNILDTYISAAQFIQSLSGSYPPAISAFWQQGSYYGTYYCAIPDFYCPHGVGVYVLNYDTDTDEYDDDVLWHEYGHFIAANYSKDDSPGGAHYISSNDLDMRLSWSEGWGDFFPGAVKAWLGAGSPLLSTMPLMASSVYVDTSGTSGNYFDFGNPPSNPAYYYSSSEAAVAKVLIDVRNTHGMQAVWDTFVSGSVKNATAPVNFEVFWDGWNLLGKPDITATLSARSILYSADSYEVSSDNTPNASRKAVLALAENHTLFDSTDIDYIAFDATAGSQYTVRTTALRNGADTVIRIIAPDQITEKATNDNTNGANYSNIVPSDIYPALCDQWGECHENGSDILGSTASFTPTVPGTYYVEVKSSPSRPLSAGKYGNYTLTITSP
ncbi:MAG: pre-peptidase C-terminal domain-containing protein [Gallionella sp.]|nr:pre-peptidase C-terminal domain-containing protein [Gallionella sp.]